MRPHGPHFLLPAGSLDEGEALLEGDDAHHLGRALRAVPGDPVSLADGAGTMGQGRVATVDTAITLEIEARWEVPPATPALRVVHALPKGRKLDGVVRALTEVGVERIDPVTTARTETAPKGAGARRAVQRWRSVAHAAAKQSRRAWLPRISEIAPYPRAFDPGDTGAVLWEEGTAPLSAVLGRISAPGECLLVVGPEGGLSADEVELAGLPAATLGPTVLRTETAAVVGAAAVLALSGRA